MNSKIEEIHEAMLRDLDDKPWQLKGEVSAKSRPQDSLLEEYVEFDHTTRQAPIIDATFTERLEKLIKQRIRDKAFDDVERKMRPVEMHYEYKKQIALDSEKSKLGLGQIYEQDYLKQQQRQIDSAAEPNVNSFSFHEYRLVIPNLRSILKVNIEQRSSFKSKTWRNPETIAKFVHQIRCLIKFSFYSKSRKFFNHIFIVYKKKFVSYVKTFSQLLKSKLFRTCQQ